MSKKWDVQHKKQTELKNWKLESEGNCGGGEFKYDIL
jgi:hypothetical protein